MDEAEKARLLLLGHQECSHCRKFDETVFLAINPYQHDINGVEIEEWFCPECYQSCKDDI